MADDNNDVGNVCRLKILDAAFDYRSITKGKQWLESAHAARASSGEQNCRNVVQVEVVFLLCAFVVL
jgi:hypothetical protein